MFMIAPAGNPSFAENDVKLPFLYRASSPSNPIQTLPSASSPNERASQSSLSDESPGESGHVGQRPRVTFPPSKPTSGGGNR